LNGAVAAFILFVAFCTAVITGIFSLAGGLILMGALALMLPVSAAFVTHGFIQIIANGWRAILHRTHIRWSSIGYYAAGSVLAGAGVALVALTPSKPLLYLMLGLVSFIVWLPKNILRLDAQIPAHGFVAGLSVTGLNLAAGVAGPLAEAGRAGHAAVVAVRGRSPSVDRRHCAGRAAAGPADRRQLHRLDQADYRGDWRGLSGSGRAALFLFLTGRPPSRG